MSRYWVDSGKKRRGPFTIEQINEAMRKGALSGDELVEDDAGQKHFVRTLIATGSPPPVVAPPQSLGTNSESARAQSNDSWALQFGRAVQRFFATGPADGALVVEQLDINKLVPKEAGYDDETIAILKTLNDHFHAQLDAIALKVLAMQEKAKVRSILSDATLLIGGVLIAAAMIFPPWMQTFQREGISQVRKPAGYYFLLTPPDPNPKSVVVGITLDWSRLSAQIGALAILTAVSQLVVRRVTYLRARQPAIVR